SSASLNTLPSVAIFMPASYNFRRIFSIFPGQEIQYARKRLFWPFFQVLDPHIEHFPSFRPEFPVIPPVSGNVVRYLLTPKWLKLIFRLLVSSTMPKIPVYENGLLFSGKRDIGTPGCS